MNQHKPLAERNPELLRIEHEQDIHRENNLRKLADNEFMKSLCQLEQTLAGEEEGLTTCPIVPEFTELDELAEAVADIEAYIQEHNQASN